MIETLPGHALCSLEAPKPGGSWMSEEEMATIANMMRAMFAEQERKLDARFEAIDKRFEAIDKRFEAIDKRFEAIDKRFEELDARFESFRIEVGVDIARHFNAVEESLRAQIGALDDKYSDLPARVAKLENGAPGPRRGVLAPVNGGEHDAVVLDGEHALRIGR